MDSGEISGVDEVWEYLRRAQEELDALKEILSGEDGDEEPALAFLECAHELQRLINDATCAALRPLLESHED